MLAGYREHVTAVDPLTDQPLLAKVLMPFWSRAAAGAGGSFGAFEDPDGNQLQIIQLNQGV